MTDYSISAKLKVDDSDIRRVRKEFWMLGREVAQLSQGIKKSLGGALGGLTVGVGNLRVANRNATRAMEDDYKRLGRAALREMRMVDRATLAGARRSSGDAASAVKAMLAAERGIDAQIADLARPRKQETADSVGGRYGGGTASGMSMFAANVAAGALLRVVDYSVAAIGRWTSGLVDSAKQMMETQRELQVTRVGIASLYVANGQDIGSAMSRSGSTMTALRRQAAEGIGGLSDYAKAYQTLQTPMAQAGRSEADLLKIVRLTIAAGGAMEGKLGIRTAPIDVLQALGKGATDAQTRILANVIRGGGKSLDQFNQMDSTRKIEFLLTALEKWEPAAKMMGKTIDSMEETIKDWRENVFGVAMSARAADVYSRSLDHQISLMKDNEAALTSYNKTLGISLGVLSQFKEEMVAARAEADVATATNRNSIYQAQRAAGGMEMLHKHLSLTESPLKKFYMGLDAAGQGLISLGSRAAATVGLMLSLKDPRYKGNMSAFFGDLGEIWTHLPDQDPLQGNDIWSGKARTPGAYTKEALHPGQLGAAIAKGMQQHARRDRLEVHARLDWGDPRSLSLSLERMIGEVAQRAYAIRVQSDAYPAYPG